MAGRLRSLPQGINTLIVKGLLVVRTLTFSIAVALSKEKTSRFRTA